MQEAAGDTEIRISTAPVGTRPDYSTEVCRVYINGITREQPLDDNPYSIELPDANEDFESRKRVIKVI